MWELPNLCCKTLAFEFNTLTLNKHMKVWNTASKNDKKTLILLVLTTLTIIGGAFCCSLTWLCSNDCLLRRWWARIAQIESHKKFAMTMLQYVPVIRECATAGDLFVFVAKNLLFLWFKKAVDTAFFCIFVCFYGRGKNVVMLMLGA